MEDGRKALGGCEAEGGGGRGQELAWDDDLSKGHIVVGHEDELQQVADVWVGIDLVAHRADQLDDALGHLIPGCRLAANHAHARHHLHYYCLEKSAL